jgi:4-diphosphocytidyl-2-C-methyl-D-erythritol kinase
MSISSLFDVPAPGKINLFLHVLGRRPDGYHLLQSAFVLIDWYDTLHFELRRDGQLARHDLTTALPAEDLCLRAARALQVASGCELGCDISIDKRLPSGAGLGGGSSDAASVLLALNQLWGLKWPRQKLHRIALSLGADVPFFVGGSNAWVQGIGDELTPISLDPHWLAIVKPPCHSDTSRIFNSPFLVRCNEPATMPGLPAASAVYCSDKPDAGDECGQLHVAKVVGKPDCSHGKASSSMNQLFCDFGRNDLQPVVEAEFPEVVRAGLLLRELFGNSRMTGSGSAVFSVLREGGLAACSGQREVSEELDLLQAKLPKNWSVRVCQSLASHPLRDWAWDALENSELMVLGNSQAPV